MLSQALRRKAKRSPKGGSIENGESSRSRNDDGGHAGEIAFCDGSSNRLTYRDLLLSSVQVLGEGNLGMVQKVVWMDGLTLAAKRLHPVAISKGEFSKRVEKLATLKSEYLVPTRAYFYSKRTKLVLYDYYPMGSLADLLRGAKEHGHTPLDWQGRIRIATQVARAISFIHRQNPSPDKDLQMNVHGSIKSTNIFLRIDFSACLSNYGYLQLVESIHVPPSQKCDVHSFGVVLMELLGGLGAVSKVNLVMERRDEIKTREVKFFDFAGGEREIEQACEVLRMALECLARSPEERPSMEQILLVLEAMAFKCAPIDCTNSH
ncbi:hypothetical protein AMTRI_Chr01g108440 [Amborella trichopoda]|uniref:Protein kinase domain-containing protein n=1 Tax=Amborella trichopoda TaxID=13333 RepID=W1P042_AMBTC|nr:probable inactive receptor kinase At2g26730 [Amborella trichopoda]ERN00315.1 hypothetical protein AMTR_s00107p00140790 [Amborella trichopoda]|eukprot:XP_006837461.1 probable inactive receptor kinase At2g26730 [Amborella trichopoda]